MTQGSVRQPQEPWPNLRRLVLSGGFLALALGILFAWASPASRYEISIYTATPDSFWIAVGIALGASILVCAIHPRDRVALYGIGLGGLAMASIATLPVIRGYRFLGAADAMTHLGYAEDIRDGLIGPTELLYPGGHSAAVVLAEAFGLATERAMMFWIVVLLVIYLIFVPLLARAIVDHPVVAVIAAFSGFLLLPFNNVSTVYQFHTYSLGVMLLPLFGYVLVRYLQSGTPDRLSWGSLGGWQGALIGVGIAMLFVHPQVTLNLVILLGTFAGVHYLSSRRSMDHPLTQLRPTYGAFGVLGVLWFVWSFQHWQALAALENLVGAAYFTVFGDQEAGQAAAEAGVSTSELGASLTELFLKIFFVSGVYGLLAAVVVALALLATVRHQYRRDLSVITYVGVGGFVLGPFFLLHFLGDISQYFFRHLGFAMVFITVLGALGVFYLADGIAGDGGSPSLRVIGVWFLAAALVLSIPVIFSSPYIYLPSAHVTDGEVDGYSTAFDISDEDMAWSGIRAGPGRFFDGVTPGERPIEAAGHSTDGTEDMLNLSAGEAEEDLYLPVSDRDYEREVIAYQEILYDAESFDEIDESPHINHVHSNGDFDLYYVRATD